MLRYSDKHVLNELFYSLGSNIVTTNSCFYNMSGKNIEINRKRRTFPMNQMHTYNKNSDHDNKMINA